MNERIKELAQQAEIYAGELIDEGANWDDAPIYYTEKFAELIVRECADIATMNQYQHFATGTYVLKHFGVEE